MKITQRRVSFIIALAITGFMPYSKVHSEEEIKKAVAVIYPTKGNTVSGKVTFTAVGGGVHIVADMEGLKPGDHGFHIHEFGDCSSTNGSSAGDHYNPTNKRHGCPNNPDHHVGDMGNITANEKGKAHYDQINKDIKLGGQTSIIGRSVVIHEGADDCTTQPSGNSGAKIGCGVIGIGK